MGKRKDKVECVESPLIDGLLNYTNGVETLNLLDEMSKRLRTRSLELRFMPSIDNRDGRFNEMLQRLDILCDELKLHSNLLQFLAHVKRSKGGD